MNKIVISHALYKDGMDMLEGKAELIVPNNGNSDEIIDVLKTADAFILRIGKIDRKAIEQCPDLKVITRPGVGYDNVDVKAATEHGIPVVICPAANSRAVAEHTISMLFALSKNTVESVNETKKGNFAIRNKYVAVDVLGKTITILGFGHIGRLVAGMCSALDMKVVVYDPFVSQEKVEQLGYGYSSDMLEAISMGDYVSLHMPSMPETRGLMSEKQFAAMKPTAFFLNAARGDLVDEDVMVKYLKEKKIAGAGLDVIIAEPMPADHPIMALDNVVITPHMAAQTRETVSTIVKMAAEGTLAVLNGEKWPHVANPEVYEHPIWKNR